MATKKPKKGPTPVEAIVHADKRANLPLADAHEFVSPEVEEIPKLRYPRDPSLDPQLVWKGKDAQDSEDLEVDTPPIYIQEKIDPRVLIENLRQTARAGETEPELALFETFDGLDDLDIVDYYKHDANWSNRMILGDSLQVMASLAERESLRGQVQTIYVDPPYGIKFNSNWQVSVRNSTVKDGKLEDATREVEMIRAFRDTWELGIHSYLTYLRDRLLVAKDLLTASGSTFVQIGDENVHLVRSLLDEVFGSENFVSLITMKKTSSSGAERLDGVSDYLLWYAQDLQVVKYRQLYFAKGVSDFIPSAYSRVELADGTRRAATPTEKLGQLPAGARLYALDNLTSSRPAQGSDVLEYEFEGRTFTPGRGTFKTDKAGLDRLARAGRLEATASRLGYVRFLDDFPAIPIDNLWTDTVSSFMPDKAYVVQTNVRIIERCITMTTDPGDLVLDPTCGSGTTAFVAERWGRRWITVDTSRVALALARQRLMGARFPYFVLADSKGGREREAEVTGQPMPHAETGNDIRRGFVYQRVQRITLGSIASNPDIGEGMSRQEIGNSIKRHADHEVLVDSPFQDKATVRVTGPFTVESLSPHRSLAFASASEVHANARGAHQRPQMDSFEAMILENLRRSGIQNGKRQERLNFAVLEPHGGSFIQAVGKREDPADGPRRIGIAIGPQYGTVGPSIIKEAAREAIATRDLDLLCVLAFAFDPQAVGATGEDYVSSDEGFDVAAERKLGRVPVLLVRMNADLLMGEELKKTGAGNLFTVFGEPDILIKEDRDELTVELLGVDVYDPTTGEVRSNTTDQIALWMIDTAYNGESFFVRHCYFTGGHDPYKRLRTALKAEIDAEAWESLYRTVSRPFSRPETGRIAVKVINDYGDEVLKVFDV